MFSFFSSSKLRQGPQTNDIPGDQSGLQEQELTMGPASASNSVVAFPSEPLDCSPFQSSLRHFSSGSTGYTTRAEFQSLKQSVARQAEAVENINKRLDAAERERREMMNNKLRDIEELMIQISGLRAKKRMNFQHAASVSKRKELTRGEGVHHGVKGDIRPFEDLDILDSPNSAKAELPAMEETVITEDTYLSQWLASQSDPVPWMDSKNNQTPPSEDQQKLVPTPLTSSSKTLVRSFVKQDSFCSLSSGIESLPPSTIRKSPSIIDLCNSDGEGSFLEYQGGARGAGRKRKRRAVSYAPSVTSSGRRVRGRSALVEQKVLLPSLGKSKGIAWPAKGKNTDAGRLKEIICDMCKGRVHWACASLEEWDDPEGEPWCCPHCENDIDNEQANGESIAQQDRCLRPDCILRSTAKKENTSNSQDQFIMEKIIGRKLLKRLGNAQRVYQYLVKWQDYEIWDCTWEPPKNIAIGKDRKQKVRAIEEIDRKFIDECKKLDIHWDAKVALLPEALLCWNEEGLRKRRQLLAEGVEPKTWWIGDDDPKE